MYTAVPIRFFVCMNFSPCTGMSAAVHTLKEEEDGVNAVFFCFDGSAFIFIT